MNFLEWYLRLPARPESEDVGWSIVLHRARPAGAIEWGVAVAIAALALISLISYFRQSRELPSRLRIVLLSLRVSAVLLVALLLAGFGLTAQSVGRPTLVIMLDVSASMSTRDVVSSSDEGEEDPSERLRVAVDRLLDDDARVLRDLVERYRVRIYQFGGDAQLIAAIDTPDDVGTAITSVSGLEADAAETRPAAAIDDVLRGLRGQSIAAIVAMTDGVSSTAGDDRWSNRAEELVETSVPFAAIPVGSETLLTEIQIVEAYLPESAWVGQPVTFLVQLRCRGADGRDVDIELRQVGSDVPASQTTISVEGNDVREWVSLPVMPSESGQFEYQVTVVPLSDERETHNNQVTRSIDVREGRIRVLLVERMPRWEYRHLKAILERDALVELDTVLLWADAGYVEEDATALPAFPSTREALLGPIESVVAPPMTIDSPTEIEPEGQDSEAIGRGGYDVIIWGDVDPDSLLPDALANVQDFVRLKGGGLVLIAGMQHNPWNYFDSPLASLLPFPAEGFDTPPAPAGISGFRQQRTPDGRTFGFLRFDNDPDRDDDVWNNLPRIHWLLPIERLKAGAQSLAEHPTLRGASGNMPTLIYQRYGAGQIVYLATDEFWQWRDSVEDMYLGRFWSQMIRTMTPPRDRDSSEGVELVSRQPVYAEGEPVQFRSEFVGGTHYPGDGLGEVVVERDAAVIARIALSPSEHLATSLEGQGTPLPAGSYRAWLSAPSVPGTLPSCRFQVDPGQRELLETIVDRGELKRTADQTGGMLFELNNIDRLVDLLPAGRRVPTSEATHIPLWSRPEALLLLTLLLACEWSLRRKHRLT